MTVIIKVLLIVLFIRLGFKISLEDFRTGRISNKNIILGFKILGAAFGALILLSVLNYTFQSRQVNSPLLSYILAFIDFLKADAPLVKFYPLFMMHTLWVLVCAIALWKLQIWPAGDAKLYILLALSASVLFYGIDFLYGKLFLVILINSFIPAAVFFTGYLFFVISMRLLSGKYDNKFKDSTKQLSAKFKAHFNKDSAGFAKWLFLAVNYFVLFSLLQSAGKYVHIGIARFITDPLMVFAVLFLFWNPMRRYMMSKRTTVIFLGLMIIYLVSGVFIYPHKIAADLTSGVSMLFRFGAFMMFFKTFLGYYFDTARKHIIKTEDLLPGMILTSNSLRQVRISAKIQKENFDDVYSDGLTAEQIEKIQKLDNPGGFEVVKAKPFALWLWIGWLITIIIKSDLMSFTATAFPSFAGILFKLTGR